ncbi:MAG: hypothetical protein H0X29_02285 [Parachlamydiaceae bacterium]|nr:hypothetical protein [Parachlamydiaceae bacterium]
MTKHEFLFSPGQWVGEGRITFSSSADHLRFYTKWLITKDAIGNLLCQQHVEMEGGQDRVINAFLVSNITPDSFAIELSNDLLDKVSGKGIIDPQTIAWEFRGHNDFEGFEVYESQANGDYMLHAEYSSLEQFRTIIDGRIWKKST